MRRPRIYHVGPAELANPAESLKHRLIDHIPFKLIQVNESVNGIPDLIWLRRIAHVTSRSNAYQSFSFPICTVVKIQDIVVAAIMIADLWQSTSRFGHETICWPEEDIQVFRMGNAVVVLLNLQRPRIGAEAHVGQTGRKSKPRAAWHGDYRCSKTAITRASVDLSTAWWEGPADATRGPVIPVMIRGVS